jgi:hypothetical protein
LAPGEIVRRFAIVLTLLSSFTLHAAVFDPVVEYDSSAFVFPLFPFTLGYSFSTTTPFHIDALGVYDDGLGSVRRVGLWDSAGNLLTSTTIQAFGSRTGPLPIRGY